MMIAIAALLLLGACDKPASTGLLGYVEADYVYAAPVSGGRITDVAVKRGDTVAAGTTLFTLDAVDETAKVAQARAALEEAKAKLADLETGERRKMVTTKIVGEEEVDEAESALLADRGHIAEYTARLAAAKLPARAQQIAAAGHAVAEAEAALASAQWALDQRTVVASADGRIEDVYFRVGEEVTAGAAVLQLLPPPNLKLRLYVPEPLLGGYKIGQKLAVACDGCAAGQTATISFIATTAEFTPPVIYSRESRAKLVYLIEARPDDTAQAWHPGQPIEAEPQ
jgi:HlyD family secretion protein